MKFLLHSAALCVGLLIAPACVLAAPAADRALRHLGICLNHAPAIRRHERSGVGDVGLAGLRVCAGRNLEYFQL